MKNLNDINITLADLENELALGGYLGEDKTVSLENIQGIIAHIQEQESKPTIADFVNKRDVTGAKHFLEQQGVKFEHQAMDILAKAKNDYSRTITIGELCEIYGYFPKLELTSTRVSYREVEYGHLEEVINKYFGRDFEFAVDQECGNDTKHTFNIEKEPTLDKWVKDTAEIYMNSGKGNFICRDLLRYLCYKGIIEPNEYLVKVSW